MKTFRQRVRLAFTLVELLVVIAVIGILAALLLTAISQVKGRALRIQCVSNVRQLGLALHQFADENYTYPLLSVNPKYDANTNIVRVATWEKAILPQLSTINRDWWQQGVWTCPAFKSKVVLHLDLASYGYNAFGLSGTNVPANPISFGLCGYPQLLELPIGPNIVALMRPNVWPVVDTSVKEGAVVSPSEMMAIADGFVGSGDQLYAGQNLFWRERVFLRGSFETATVYARHQGKANVVFCDGHVESPTLQFLFADTSDEALSRWNRDHQPHRERLVP
jgi:prepilin-type processing-associated H-X9-DG protein/prepilin-type N-terminal cleavage/methylation domain-containing protein